MLFSSQDDPMKQGLRFNVIEFRTEEMKADNRSRLTIDDWFALAKPFGMSYYAPSFCGIFEQRG